MPEESFQEKTEQPTPKKLEKAREEGNVAKSTEFNSVFILFFSMITLYFFSSQMLASFRDLCIDYWSSAGTFAVDTESLGFLMRNGMGFGFKIVAPLMLVTLIVGISVNVGQFGFLFTFKPLMPKFSRLNPVAGLKRFISLKSTVELAKSLAKVLLVALLAYLALQRQKESYLGLIHEDIGGIIEFVYMSVFTVALHITGALLLVAVLDFAYQKWQYKKDLRMTRQDIKDEHKESEGDPLVKSTIRSIQRDQARRRMMDDVPDADVVVTNPTHLAVAMKYDPETMRAPRVLAKGARLIAQRIKELAKEHGIPVHENKPLARSLFKSCKIGHEIPHDLFQAVAEVFAYVYQLKQKRSGSRR